MHYQTSLQFYLVHFSLCIPHCHYQHGDLIQAKGKKFSLKALLNDEKKFQNFATIYLSPSNYHRIHARVDGKLLRMDYIGGDLFSVNQLTVSSVDNIFARNERVVCYFDIHTIVLVGAIFVILEELQSIPTRDVSIKIDNILIDIIQITNRTIKLVKLTKIDPS
jgi:phosphatidylserine decarboxylase precursor